jgi:hypothetical protein
MTDNAEIKGTSTELILRNTTPAENRSLPRRYHSYVVLRDDGDENRRQIATVKFAYRPKTAGGSSWEAVIADAECAQRSFGDVVVYSSDLKKLCEIIRYVVTEEGSPPSHWR